MVFKTGQDTTTSIFNLSCGCKFKACRSSPTLLRAFYSSAEGLFAAHLSHLPASAAWIASHSSCFSATALVLVIVYQLRSAGTDSHAACFPADLHLCRKVGTHRWRASSCNLGAVSAESLEQLGSKDPGCARMPRSQSPGPGPVISRSLHPAVASNVQSPGQLPHDPVSTFSSLWGPAPGDAPPAASRQAASGGGCLLWSCS